MSVPNRLWRRWHRWFGVALAVPVFVLAATGLILNHADRFELSGHLLPPVLAAFYGPLSSPHVTGMHTREGWWFALDQRLISPQGETVVCQPPFLGVVYRDEQALAGCGEELLVLSRRGIELERLSSAWGLPPFSALGATEAGELVLEREHAAVRFDPATLVATPLAGGTPWQRVQPEAVPPTQVPARHLVPAEFNWERLVQDVHAGRVLGRFGWLLMDLSALFLLVLAGTGLVVWTRSRGRSR